MASQWDLSLAYSPRVATACEEIKRAPLNAAEYSARSNLVAVVSNGTVMLGLLLFEGVCTDLPPQKKR